MYRVAVIGAGPSGLVALKTLIQYGFAAKCFECEPDIGGLWNYRSPTTPFTGYAQANYKEMSYPVYKSMNTNTGWYNTTFSDFAPHSVLGQAKHNDILDYLRKYAQFFQLSPHIQCNSAVMQLCKDKQTWIVHYKQNNHQHQECFDKVLVATGAVRYPKVPFFPNEDTFDGICVHSSQVRDEDALFRNRRVLFLGGGYSGTDLAFLALKRNAEHVSIIPTSHYPNKRVWIWNRRGSIFNRCAPNAESHLMTGSLEWDYQMTFQNSVDSDKFNAMLGKCTVDIFGDETKGSPDFSFDIAGMTDSVEYLQEQRNLKNLEVYKSPIAAFGRKSIILNDNTVVKDLDVVVKATGYVHRFPFLNHMLDVEEQRRCELYKCMLPTRAAFDGLAFVLIQRALVVIPLAEMNARWLCEKFVPKPYVSEDGALYTEDERKDMTAYVDAERRSMTKGSSMTYTKHPAVHVHELASDINCTPPNHERLLRSEQRSDVELGVALYHGPFLGTRYRLRGFGSVPGAAHTLINVAKEVLGEHFENVVDEHLRKNSKN